jgi:acyl-coenzyme A thioesterase PaaI-like protein
MEPLAIQDTYPDEVSYCYGCGRLNPEGLHLKTYLEGEETVSRFTPRPYHTAIPGYVYGGLLASLVDCHSTGSAAAFAARARGLDPLAPPPRFVTASLQVDFLRPTPLVPLELRGRAVEIKGRKMVIESELYAQGTLCVRGRVVAVEMPEEMLQNSKSSS